MVAYIVKERQIVVQYTEGTGGYFLHQLNGLALGAGGKLALPRSDQLKSTARRRKICV